jgi:hypothetical protein
VKYPPSLVSLTVLAFSVLVFADMRSAFAQNQLRPGFYNAELRAAVANAAPLLERTPEQLSRDGFSSAYGRAVVQDVANVLQASSDPACLQAKGVGGDFLRSVDDLLGNYGASIIRRHRDAADPRKYEEGFARRAGAQWKAELKALREDEDVKKYLALREPLDTASVVANTTEILDRYLTLARIKLSAPIFSLFSRDEQVKRANPYDTAGQALSDFLSTNKSARIKRWEQLEVIAAVAWLDAVSDDALRALLRPRDLVPDFGARLQALCVSGRR